MVSHMIKKVNKLSTRYNNCDIPHQIGEKVPNVIYVWASLNLVDMS